MPERTLPHQHRETQKTFEMQTQLNNIQKFQTVADIFKQLGDTTRIRIFWLLCHCEECVINISAMLQMSSPAVSHHLRPLRGSGLIISRRDGKEVYYRAADTPQSQLLHQMIEQVIEITCPKENEESSAFWPLHPRNVLDAEVQNDASIYPPEQIDIIRKIHKQLTDHMEQRFTIEELSRQYLINPTTLKAVFKSVYGTSLAAHMKEHRMQQAAKLLRETNLSIAEIAGHIGYDSQSKFTAAFKRYYGKLPKDYRNVSL